MRTIKIIILLLSFGFISCDDYTDVGDNPNQLNSDVATPDQYLPAAQTLSFSTQASTMERLGLLFSNACGGNVQTYASPFNDEFTFNITTNFYTGIWQGLYLRAGVYQKIIDFNDPDSKYLEYKAISKIGKVYNMAYIVDLYGDAPYTEAFKGIANPTPKYDDDYVIYQKLFTELDEARQIIADLAAGTYPASNNQSDSYDMIFGGNMGDWEKFANTLELRMLLRMSNVTGAAATFRDARLATLDTNFITADVTIQPGYSDSRNDTVNPLVYNFGWDLSANKTNYDLYAASGHIAKCVNTYANINYAVGDNKEIVPGSGVFYPDLADPRAFLLFTKIAGSHRAVTQGSFTVDVYKPGGLPNGQPSKFAAYFFNAYNRAGTTTTLPTTVSSGGAGNTLAKVAGYVMTLAEARFMQAEAAHLGTIKPGYAVLGLDAQSNFDAGVAASMSFYNVAAAAATTYLTTVNSTKPNFGYNPAFTYSQNYNAIMYQKWFGTLSSNAIESYIDNTRTGYPINPVPLTASNPKRPNRLIYPNSEYIANANNVPNVTEGDIYSVNAKSPFWLQ